MILIIFSGAWGNANPLILGLAYDLHYERGMDQSVSPQSYQDLYGFYEFENFYWGAEFGLQRESNLSGQQTYSVKRSRRFTLFEMMCLGESWDIFRPYFSVGLGAYQDTITTVFMSSSTQDTSRLYGSGFGGVGLRMENMLPVFITFEARLLFGENLDPQPNISAMAKLGWIF